MCTVHCIGACLRYAYFSVIYLSRIGRFRINGIKPYLSTFLLWGNKTGRNYKIKKGLQNRSRDHVDNYYLIAAGLPANKVFHTSLLLGFTL